MADDEENLFSDFEKMYYSKKDKVKSYRELVLEQINKCQVEGSKQMKKGGQYMTAEGYVMTADDQREIYVSCVETLFDLLYFAFDKDANEKLDGLQNIYEDDLGEDDLGEIPLKIKKLSQKYYNKYVEREWYAPYKDQAKKERRMVEGERSNVSSFLTQQKEDERRALYRKVFIELILLFKRKNELSGIRRASVM